MTTSIFRFEQGAAKSCCALPNATHSSKVVSCITPGKRSDRGRGRGGGGWRGGGGEREREITYGMDQTNDVYYMAINVQKGWSVTFVIRTVSYGPVN